MDQLELLKQQWQASTDRYPHYTTEQLTALAAKRSRGIVKWLFYIALIEFAVFALLSLLLVDTESQQYGREIAGDVFYFGSFVLHYAVVVTFIYLFYKNHKSISATQPTRSLMKTILKTRRTMKWYIWYNLTYIMIFMVVFAVLILYNDPEIATISTKMHVNPTTFNLFFIGFYFVVAAVLCGVIYLVYSLIYGILLRRLRANYEELKKTEV